MCVNSSVGGRGSRAARIRSNKPDAATERVHRFLQRPREAPVPPLPVQVVRARRAGPSAGPAAVTFSPRQFNVSSGHLSASTSNSPRSRCREWSVLTSGIRCRPVSCLSSSEFRCSLPVRCLAPFSSTEKKKCVAPGEFVIFTLPPSRDWRPVSSLTDSLSSLSDPLLVRRQE